MKRLLICVSKLALFGCLLCLLSGCEAGEDPEDSVAFVIADGNKLDVYINDTFLVTADAEAHYIAMSDIYDVAGIKGGHCEVFYTYPDDGNKQEDPHALFIEGHKDKKFIFKSGERPVDVQVLEVEEIFGQGPYTRTTYRIKIME